MLVRKSSFLVRHWRFVHVNNLYVSNGSYEKNTTLLTITPNQAFCQVYNI